MRDLVLTHLFYQSHICFSLTEAKLGQIESHREGKGDTARASELGRARPPRHVRHFTVLWKAHPVGESAFTSSSRKNGSVYLDDREVSHRRIIDGSHAPLGFTGHISSPHVSTNLCFGRSATVGITPTVHCQARVVEGGRGRDRCQGACRHCSGCATIFHQNFHLPISTRKQGSMVGCMRQQRGRL